MAMCATVNSSSGIYAAAHPAGQKVTLAGSASPYSGGTFTLTFSTPYWSILDSASGHTSNPSATAAGTYTWGGGPNTLSVTTVDGACPSSSPGNFFGMVGSMGF